jgi:hypothetical protein
MKTRLILYLAGLTLILSQYQNCSEQEFSSIPVPKPTEPTAKCSANQLDLCEAQSDSFTIAARSNKIDIFLVIDNSGSMKLDNNRLAAKMSQFMDKLRLKNISDWQVCYTTTDIGRQDGQALNWLYKNAADVEIDTGAKVLKPGFNPTPVDFANENAFIDNTFTTSVGQYDGGGSGDERGIVAMKRAYEKKDSDNFGCFRDDALLAYVIISDEDEYSTGRDNNRLTAEDEPDALLAVVNPAGAAVKKSMIVQSLVIESQPAAANLSCYADQDAEASSPVYYGLMYEELSRKTGGLIASICSADYSTVVEDFAVNANDVLASVTLACVPVLGPQISPKVVNNGVTMTAGTYKLQGNKVIFTPALPEGSQVRVDYYCQKPSI